MSFYCKIDEENILFSRSFLKLEELKFPTNDLDLILIWVSHSCIHM